MYKKITSAFVVLSIVTLFSSSAFAAQSAITGFARLQNKMSLNIINKLQATADNDGVSFAKDWPDEYFSGNDKITSYIYLAKNGNGTLDVISFDITQNHDSCFSGENPDFCLPVVKPVIHRFTFNNGFFFDEIIPDFVNNPYDSEKTEVLTKDGKFFDNRYVKKLKKTIPDNTYKSCNYNDEGVLSVCMSYNKETDELLYTEALEYRKNSSGGEDVYKYVKTSADGNLLDEYNYSKGSRTIYDSEGNVKYHYQITDDKFVYFASELPELYIENRFVKNTDGIVTGEMLYDRNHKLIRSYTAKYKPDTSISEIMVNDYITGKNWSIAPIGINDETNVPFKIRF